ncbi:LysE family translocator [Hymenobacter koreensis]|uniref:LysE family translocator n=1 Tax=Hymenobacter koreensis TaxID=1084523 RepID=A0ABP8IYA1_9BACT
MGIDNLWTFLVAALLFTMTPGLDTIFILNKSLSQGKQAGFYATLGINTGVLVHTLFAALGLSVLVAQSAVAFSVVKYAGAAYLVYLGVAKLLRPQPLLEAADPGQVPRSGAQDFFSGVVTNVLNPKVALFFLAFFPQFIQPQALTSPWPFLQLGGLYAAVGLGWFSILTLFASYFSARVVNSPHASRWLNRLSGVAFLAMGLKLALTKR